jgi:hypothetical protein
MFNEILFHGLINLVTALGGIVMTTYLLRINGNGLKSILVHLFGAWSLSHLIEAINSLYFFSYGDDVIPSNHFKFILSLIVMVKFFALIRLFDYITKK